jgi:hypothetical protein
VPNARVTLYVGGVQRLALLLAVCALAGCGSMSVAELPPPAGKPASPPLGERPAGRVESVLVQPAVAARPEIDRARDRLSFGGRSVRTGREPIDVAVLDRGKKVAVLTGRERTLEIYDAKTLERVGKTGAGIGPTALATDDVEMLYVTDVKGDALLVFHLRPRFELIRRVHQSGGPYAIAYDRERWGLWMTLARTNQLVHYSAGSRPVWRETFPSIRDARSVTVGDDDAIRVSSTTEAQELRPRSR